MIKVLEDICNFVVSISVFLQLNYINGTTNIQHTLASMLLMHCHYNADIPAQKCSSNTIKLIICKEVVEVLSLYQRSVTEILGGVAVALFTSFMVLYYFKHAAEHFEGAGITSYF